MEKTIFDKILTKEIPAKIIYEDDVVLAFHDISPQAKVHVLVIPKKKATSLNDLKNWSPQDAGLFLQKVSHVAQVLGLEQTGYRTVLNTGPDSCQSVHYIHAHILGGESLSGHFG